MMSIVSLLGRIVKESYLLLRQDVGKRIGIEKIIRVYLPSPKTEEKLNKASKNVSILVSKVLKKIRRNAGTETNVDIGPEDICLVLIVLAGLPSIYFVCKLGWWRWALESYTCLVVPALVTFQALESENHEKVGDILIYWVFIIGLSRIMETLIDIRNIFPMKYVLGKSGLAVLLMNPRFQGISFISKHFVRNFVLPLFGMRDKSAKRKLVQIRNNSYKVVKGTISYSDENNTRANELKIGDDTLKTKTGNTATNSTYSSGNDGNAPASNVSSSSNSTNSDFSYVDVDNESEKKIGKIEKDVAIDEIALHNIEDLPNDNFAENKDKKYIKEQKTNKGSGGILYNQAQSI